MPTTKSIILPSHCREVSVKKASFPLTEERITEELTGSKVYTSTRYIVLRKNDESAVVEVEKPDTGKLFTNITKVNVISLPEQTVFVEDTDIDVLNPNFLFHTAKNYVQKTVVVKGKFEHVSFIHGRDSIKLRVFDVIPPTPAKLVTMVEKVLELQKTRIPVEIIPDITDLRNLTNNASANVIFPCSASEIDLDIDSTIGGKNVFFLDNLKQPPRQSTLIGCNTSLQIYRELFNTEPDFVQMCPGEKTSSDIFITKCCELKEGFKKVRGGVVVPWGAEFTDVMKALNMLFKENRGVI